MQVDNLHNVVSLGLTVWQISIGFSGLQLSVFEVDRFCEKEHIKICVNTNLQDSNVSIICMLQYRKIFILIFTIKFKGIMFIRQIILFFYNQKVLPHLNIRKVRTAFDGMYKHLHMHIYINKMRNKQKIPHSRNNSKIQTKTRRKKQNRHSQHTYTWPLTFLNIYIYLGNISRQCIIFILF
jgi:hypothetical protein